MCVNNIFEEAHQGFLINNEIQLLDDFVDPIQIADITQKPSKCEPPFIISLDSEYQPSEDGKTNRILSYQYVASYRDSVSVSRILYPRENQRYRLSSFIGIVIRDALKKKVITKMPTKVYLVAHFLRADLSSFLDFFKDKTTVQGIRRTLATLKGSYGINHDELFDKLHLKENIRCYDHNNNSNEIQVRFVDTQLLTPNQRGLEHLGQIVGLEKLTIPEPYSIARMSEYLASDKVGFEAYAMRDAEVVHRYVLEFMNFTEQSFGRAFLPVTLASLGVKQFERMLKEEGINQHRFLGLVETKRKVFSRKSGKYRTEKTIQLGGGALSLERLAIECYHGGRNEAFVCGYSPEDNWYDYDLPSAYTTALLGIHPLDFDHYYQVTDPKKFCGHVLGIAQVAFKFPEHIRYPTLPVKTENGLIYPLQGISYCSAAEVEVALNLGAELEIIEGFIIPWLDQSKRPFESFVTLVRQNRKKYEKGSLYELLWKEIGNSLYGKLAQGLKGKKTFDVSAGYNKDVPRSKITCAYYASYVTGLVRAVIGELLNGIPNDKLAISVTTDGFITNAPFEMINSDQPISNRYKQLLQKLDPSGQTPILECKHQVMQVCCMRTRGQFTVQPIENKPILLAKAGIQIPESVRRIAVGRDIKQVENAYMSQLYFDRYPNQMLNMMLLPSTRDSYIQECDLIKIIRPKRLNLEFDMKRCFDIVKPLNIQQQERLFIVTKPWANIDIFYSSRACFEDWTSKHVLKTLTDYNEWNDYCLSTLATKCKRVNVSQKKGSTQLLLNQFLRCFTTKQYGVNLDLTYREIALILTKAGYPTKESAVKNAKRHSDKIELKCVPTTPQTIKLLEQLLKLCSTFEYQQFFV